VVINAAGLYADEVARLFGNERYQIHPCRGEYAEVIPAAERSDPRAGLSGPLAGWSRAGRPLYTDALRSPAAGAKCAICRRARTISKRDWPIWRASIVRRSGCCPICRLEDLRPSYTGIRAKLHPASGPAFADFIIESDHADSEPDPPGRDRITGSHLVPLTGRDRLPEWSRRS
jgi:glycine/D-amino acid oxidase-like deaminating enzyme